jgi:hypothetical protein
MADIHILPGIEDPNKTLDEQPNAYVVAQFEQVLRWAKAGKVTTIGIAMVTNDNKVRQGFAGDARNLLLAGVNILEHRIIKDRLDPIMVDDVPEELA